MGRPDTGILQAGRSITNSEQSCLKRVLSQDDINRIIEMAWEDRTPFEAIEIQFGLREQDVIALMRQELQSTSFRMWRKRVQERTTKHKALRSKTVDRFKCSRQRAIASNKISKR